MKNKQVLLGHGSGGQLSHDLISNLFVKHFDNPILRKQTDSALLEINATNLSYTTDSYVVDPIFFPGGNIGIAIIILTIIVKIILFPFSQKSLESQTIIATLKDI